MTDKRLNLICDLFLNKYVIDIGSDHAYLPIELLLKEKVEFANIIEVNQGPLKNAELNIRKKGLKNKCNLVLSDGLSSFDEEIFDNTGCVIAGMGGKLIASIIENDLEKFNQCTLYLQPNNNEYVLRERLTLNGFDIIKDILVKDNNIIYSVIVANKSKKKKNYTQTELKFGYEILKDEIYKEKWNNELDFKKNLLDKVKKDEVKFNYLKQEIIDIQNNLS